MFGDVMGLGKTIEAIGTANAMGPSRILVVCPASVLFTWRREIWKWQTLGLPVFLIQAGRDTTINHELIGWGANGWYIINYDILRDYPEIKSGKSWDLLILDKSHKLKNPEAIRTQHVFGSDTIAPIRAEKALLLTGTPMINYVHDLYTQLHFLDPAMWPSFEQFVADQYFPGYKIIAPSQVVGTERNLEQLRRQLTAVMIRRPKSVLNLPPKTREIVEVDIEDNEFWSILTAEEMPETSPTTVDEGYWTSVRPKRHGLQFETWTEDKRNGQLCSASGRHEQAAGRDRVLEGSHWQDPRVCLSPRCHREIDGDVGGPRGIWVHWKLVAKGS